MSWYNTEGNDPHVLYSKTCYIRNIALSPFQKKLGDKNREAIFKKIDSILQKNGFSCENISAGDSLKPISLTEKGFADASFVSSDTARAVYFNEPCSLSIALGGKDLITISSLLSGNSLPETRNIASGAEELLDRSLEFAFADGVGYLSPIPENCGSGVIFSALIYIPSLSKSEEIDSIRHQLAASGIDIFPTFTHKDTDLFTVTYSPPHACDEGAAAESFSMILGSIIGREKELLAIISEENCQIIADRAWKAYGALRYARLLGEGEMLSLSSQIRVALIATNGEGLPPITATALNKMLFENLNSSLFLTRKACRGEIELCRGRAESVAALLSSAG